MEVMKDLRMVLSKEKMMAMMMASEWVSRMVQAMELRTVDYSVVTMDVQMDVQTGAQMDD